MKEFIIFNNTKYLFTDYVGKILSLEKGWCYLGYLEFTNPEFHLLTDLFGSGDLVWASYQDNLMEDKYKNGIGIRYSLGTSPSNGDNTIFPIGFTIIDFLKYIINNPPIYGFSNDRKSVITQTLPDGVRLNGMKEFIMKEVKK
jgi:hypothetical protein